MKKCTLEKLVFDKASKKSIRSGETMAVFVEDMHDDLTGKIIELKKRQGLWAVNEVDDNEINAFQIKRIITS